MRLNSDMTRVATIGVGMGVGLGAVAAWWAWKRSSDMELPTKWEEVGEISQVVIYPLKSGRGVSVEEAEATTHGLAKGGLQDRSFLVVTPDGQFLTGRQAPRLTAVVVVLKGSVVSFEVDNAQKIEVDLEEVTRMAKITDAKVKESDVKAYDCGDEAAKWMSEVLYGGEKSVRLLYNGKLTLDRKARKLPYHVFPQIKDTDKVIFADNCAYMLATESSLEDLNSRLDVPVTMDYFRANFVVKGSKPYDEDDWAYAKIGNEVILRRLKPCDRCMFTCVDPEKGEKRSDSEPMATLKKYRIYKTDVERLSKAWAAKPIFGSHLGIDINGTVKVGDKVMVARASENPKWQL